MPFDRKDVFKYEAGGKQLCADPLVIYHKFMEAVEGDVLLLLERAYPPAPPKTESPAEPEPDEPQAVQMLRSASRIQIGNAMILALGQKQLDPETGEGLTAEQGETLYFDFLDWMESKKKPPDTSPMSLPSAGSASSAAPWLTKSS